MSRSASVSVARLRSGFPGVSSSTSSVASTRELDRDEDLLERLNVEIANVVTRLEVSAANRPLGFHHVLIARSLEQIGITRSISPRTPSFLMTAELREFADA